ncbi:hypothetical protein EYF80_032945 [Liparis tanakae]|uniref:Uncharacterized protein n=1 Tax=Liparis tanakae TaxID=230148 RepID=A0A4Z2GTU9_9TELE|nr:hypothetical protein EYF80_032945 [Liparis tanakae]
MRLGLSDGDERRAAGGTEVRGQRSEPLTLIVATRVSMAASSCWTCWLISCWPSFRPTTTSVKRLILCFRRRTFTSPILFFTADRQEVRQTGGQTDRRSDASSVKYCLTERHPVSSPSTCCSCLHNKSLLLLPSQ